VDSTDGALARKVRIKEVVPSFDGRRLDDLVDFLNYTFLPLLLVWRASILPTGLEAWLFLPLLASAYGFCQVQAKTDDGYFLGFPSLWNVVAFYLYALPLGLWPSLAVIVVLSILTFVPSRHLYPSQPGWINRLAILLGIPWAIVFVWLIWKLPHEGETAVSPSTIQWAWISLYYPIFYLAVSWAISLAHWQKRPNRGRGASLGKRERLVSPRQALAFGHVDEEQQQSPDHEEGDDGKDRDSARPDSEHGRPKNSCELLGNAEKAEKFP
jgi:phosphatidylcholine synthase